MRRHNKKIQIMKANTLSLMTISSLSLMMEKKKLKIINNNLRIQKPVIYHLNLTEAISQNQVAKYLIFYELLEQSIMKDQKILLRLLILSQ